MSIGSLHLLRAREEKSGRGKVGNTRGEHPAGMKPESPTATDRVRASRKSGDHPTSLVSARSVNSAPTTAAASTRPEGRVNMVRPPKEVQDHELLKRFQDGDEDGYVELYLRRQAELYTFCLRLTQGDRDFASDLFQDTWIKVYRKAHTFHEGTNVLGWLYTIVRTTFLNHQRRRPHISLDDSHANIASSDRSMHPEHRNEQATIKERVERAIAKLAIEIREPFLLREFDGFSYQEIADQLSITLGAVRQRIYRAKQAMREELWDLVRDYPSLARSDEEEKE